MRVFRSLAETGSHEAPERVEIALRQAFRSYHRARKIRRRMIAAIATAAAAACIAAFVIPAPAPPERPAAVRFHPVPPEIAWAKSEPPAQPAPAPVHKPTRRPRMEQLATTEFVSLPYGDDSLVEESATIVRVELPRSALRLAGFNVAQEHANDRIQADVVLGADGLAHAVRFVRYLE